MVKFDDVKNMSTEEYFNNNKFSIDAFNKKYALYPEETYVMALKRVCDYVASAESTEDLKKYWSRRWFDEIFNDWWHPAGSIMQGAANERKISLANCTTLSLGVGDDNCEWDSLEGIIRGAAYSVAKTAAYRQGLGLDFSRIRPRGTKVFNSSNESTGAVHWMKFIDSIGYYVGQKGRIPAMLFSLSGSHPDVLEFIEVKKDYHKIQNANISVQLTDNFYDAVEKDQDWELYFKIPAVKAGDRVYVDNYIRTADAELDEESGRWYVLATMDKQEEVISKKIKAKELLDLIAKNMFKNAEPGIQNIDIARKYSNSDALYDPGCSYDTRIISTNACSEQYLSRDGLCVLSSINAGKFSVDPEKFESELEIIAESINRFLDNVNEKELEDKRFTSELQERGIRALRRTGAGVTNLAELLFKADLLYGTKEATDYIEKFIKKYNYELYKSTIALGKEKGNFTSFNKDKIKNSKFIQKMIEEGLTFDSMRNVTVSSIAPSGTLSLMFRDMGLSTGIEPGFGLYYWKRTRISGNYKYYFCVPNVVRKRFASLGVKLPIESDTIEDTWDGKKGLKVANIINNNRDLIKFRGSPEVDLMDKLNFVSRISKHVDSSISVTFMLNENSTEEDVRNFILLAHKNNLKSIAAFPDKKLYGIISAIPFKSLALQLKEERVSLHQQNFSEEELKELSMGSSIVASYAPKRPKELDAEIYGISVKGEKFVIAIGLLNGAPYEMFGGAMNGLSLLSNKKGKITKLYRNKYKLTVENSFEIEDFSAAFDPVEQVLFRLVSSNLRHGVPVKFICEQLNKATEDLTSLARAAARVLKKYIQDGEVAHGIECPACGSTEMIYTDGCVTCSCGFSKCD